MTQTTTTMTQDETAAAVQTVFEHAASCGRLECGHLGKSTSRDVRHAVILYVAAGAEGIAPAMLAEALERSTTATQAVYGALNQASHRRPVYVRGTLASGNRGYVPATPNDVTLPDVSGFKITHQRYEVYSLAVQGYSATQIAAMTHRALETVKSHMGWLRRGVAAHDATSALVALVVAGELAL